MNSIIAISSLITLSLIGDNLFGEFFFGKVELKCEEKERKIDRKERTKMEGKSERIENDRREGERMIAQC